MIGELMEIIPKTATPRPAVEGPLPAWLATEHTRDSNLGGAYSAYGAFSAHFFGGAPVLYRPTGLASGLSSHNSLSSHISAGADRSEGHPRWFVDNCLVAPSFASSYSAS